MIYFPNAKINLGLNVLAKRTDGFHNIETVIFPVPLRDVLELAQSSDFEVKVHAAVIPKNENLIARAWKIMEKKYNVPPVEVHLLKNIPIGSGLGGGSSDTAFFIMSLNKELSLQMSQEELEAVALETGSDCPFFIRNQPAFVSGRGENIEPLPLSLKGKYLVLVIPRARISTREAYSLIKPSRPLKPLRKIIMQNPETWKHELSNDFEKIIFGKYPELEKIKNRLYAEGAVYASISGSGSAIYGIFNTRIDYLKIFRYFRTSFYLKLS